MTSDSEQSEARFLQLLSGKWVVQAISTAAELGLAEVLSKPTMLEPLSEELGCLPDLLQRLLRVLVGEGLLDLDESGSYSLTEVGEQLKSENLRELAVFVGSKPQWTPWLELTHTLRTGESAFQRAHGQSLFEYLSKHEEEARLYDRAVDLFTRRQARRMAALELFSGKQTLVDVGGGRGTLLLELLSRQPELSGVLVDLPEVVNAARERFQRAELAGRWQCMGANFFESLPEGATLYVLKHVLHNWSDARAVELLKKCSAAMAPHGKVLVVEGLLLPGKRRDQTGLMDLEMMVLTGEGRERSKPEFRRLFSRAGLKLTATHALSAGAWLLEAQRSGGGASG
jgi:hypothetical protein